MPKVAISKLAYEVPDVAILICSIASREQVILLDLVQAISNMLAQDRMLFVLLYILHRLRVTNSTMSDTFRLPLIQSTLGDMLGLTNVSISKAFTALEALELVQRNNGYVRIVDVEECAKRLYFVDRFGDLDVGWLRREGGH